MNDDIEEQRKKFQDLRKNFDAFENLGSQYQDIGQKYVQFAREGKNLAGFFETGIGGLWKMGETYPEVKTALEITVKWADFSNREMKFTISGLQSAPPFSPNLGSVYAGGYTGIGTVVSAVDQAQQANPEIEVYKFYGLPKFPEHNFQGVQDELSSYLQATDPSLEVRRKGAWQTFNSVSQDKNAQAAHSMRDILSALISKWASNDDVNKAPWWTADSDSKAGVSLKQRLRFLIYGDGAFEGEDLAILTSHIESILDDDKFLKKVAHGSSKGTDDLVRSKMLTVESAMLLIYKTREKTLK